MFILFLSHLFLFFPPFFIFNHSETHRLRHPHTHLLSWHVQLNWHRDGGTTPWWSHSLMHYKVTPLFALVQIPSGQQLIFPLGDINEGDLAFWAAFAHLHVWTLKLTQCTCTDSWIIKHAKLLRDLLTHVLLFVPVYVACSWLSVATAFLNIFLSISAK